jgi:hypothetical protein
MARELRLPAVGRLPVIAGWCPSVPKPGRLLTTLVAASYAAYIQLPVHLLVGGADGRGDDRLVRSQCPDLHQHPARLGVGLLVQREEQRLLAVEVQVGVPLDTPAWPATSAIVVA